MSRRKYKDGEPQLLEQEVVILAAVQASDKFWGYQLREIFGDEDVNNGTAYRRLRTLSKMGLLGASLESDEESGTHTGPARRIYEITESGAERLRQEAVVVQSILPVIGVEIE